MIMSLAGLEELVLGRIDYSDKTDRKENQEMEFIWELELQNTSIFTHVLYDSYTPPDFINFKKKSISAKTSTRVLDKMVKELEDTILKMKGAYRTDHLLLPIGSDFSYLNSQE